MSYVIQCPSFSINLQNTYFQLEQIEEPLSLNPFFCSSHMITIESFFLLFIYPTWLPLKAFFYYLFFPHDYHWKLFQDCNTEKEKKKITEYIRNWSQSSCSSWNSNLCGMPLWKTGLPPWWGGSKPPAIMPPFHSRK